MDLWTGISILVRRWYVTLPLVLVSIVVAAVAGTQVQRQYRAAASVVLVAPPANIVDNVRQPLDNPFDTRSLGAAVHRQLNDTDLALTLEEEGFATDFTSSFDRDASIIDIVVTAPRPELAVATAARLVQEAQAGLDRSQASAGVAPASAIDLDTVMVTERAEAERGDRFRVIVTVSLLGMVIAASAALLTESFLQHRRTLAASASASASAPGDSEPAVRDPAVRTDPANRTVTGSASGRSDTGAGRRAMPPPVPAALASSRPGPEPQVAHDAAMIDLRARLAHTATGALHPVEGVAAARDATDDGPPQSRRDQSRRDQSRRDH